MFVGQVSTVKAGWPGREKGVLVPIRASTISRACALTPAGAERFWLKSMCVVVLVLPQFVSTSRLSTTWSNMATLWLLMYTSKRRLWSLPSLIIFVESCQIIECPSGPWAITSTPSVSLALVHPRVFTLPAVRTHSLTLAVDLVPDSCKCSGSTRFSTLHAGFYALESLEWYLSTVKKLLGRGGIMSALIILPDPNFDKFRNSSMLRGNRRHSQFWVQRGFQLWRCWKIFVNLMIDISTDNDMVPFPRLPVHDDLYRLYCQTGITRRKFPIQNCDKY